MAGTMKNVTDASFERGRPQERQARPGRLLGRLVRPVPPDRALRWRRSRPSTATRSTIVKLNIDENPGTAAKYGVMSIPTLNVYQGGEVAKTIVGAKPKAAIVRDLEDFIGSDIANAE